MFTYLPVSYAFDICSFKISSSLYLLLLEYEIPQYWILVTQSCGIGKSYFCLLTFQFWINFKLQKSCKNFKLQKSCKNSSCNMLLPGCTDLAFCHISLLFFLFIHICLYTYLCNMYLFFLNNLRVGCKNHIHLCF